MLSTVFSHGNTVDIECNIVMDVEMKVLNSMKFFVDVGCCGIHSYHIAHHNIITSLMVAETFNQTIVTLVTNSLYLLSAFKLFCTTTSKISLYSISAVMSYRGFVLFVCS